MARDPIFVAVDTSSMLNITGDLKALVRFRNALISRPEIVLVVPYDVTLEMFEGGDLNRIAFRYQNLVKIWDAVGDSRFQISCRLIHSIKKELEVHGSYRTLPLLSLQKRALLKYILQTPSEVVRLRPKAETEIRESRELKDSVLQSDKETRSAFNESDLTYSKIREKFLEFKGLKRVSWHIRLARNVFYLPMLTVSKLKRIVENRNYRVLNAYLNLVVFRHLCMTHTSPETPLLHKQARGGLVDVKIAATAAYGQFLVTDDQGQQAICNEMCSRGVIDFESIQLSEFYERFGG